MDAKGTREDEGVRDGRGDEGWRSGTGRHRARRRAREECEDTRCRKPPAESLSGRRPGGLTAGARRGGRLLRDGLARGTRKFDRDSTHRGRRATRWSPRRRGGHLRTHLYMLLGGERRTPASSAALAACGKAIFGRAHLSRMASAEKNAWGKDATQFSVKFLPKDERAPLVSSRDGVAPRVRLRAHRRGPPPRAAPAPASTSRPFSPRRRRRPADPPRVRRGAVSRRGVFRDGRASRRRSPTAVQSGRGDGRGARERRVPGDASVRGA